MQQIHDTKRAQGGACTALTSWSLTVAAGAVDADAENDEVGNEARRSRAYKVRSSLLLEGCP